MRFIVEGEGGFTAVHSKRIPMERGDVILTPTWNYHDHGKDGHGPMIWLDGLDLPLFRHFPVHFVEHFSQPRYPATDVDKATSPIVFPWSDMKVALDSVEAEWATIPYTKADGQPGEWSISGHRDIEEPADPTLVSRTLGGSATRISRQCSTLRLQETASCVYHVIQGSGYSVIDGETYTWEKADTFCIPAWHAYQHFANSNEAVYLYRFDDRPMLDALGLYRRAGVDSEEYVSI
jgi:gentisate 1,2-dioxygenase